MVLGHWYLHGIGVNEDCQRARIHYLKAAEQLSKTLSERKASGLDRGPKPRLLADEHFSKGILRFPKKRAVDPRLILEFYR